jgi:hypothetical protein
MPRPLPSSIFVTSCLLLASLAHAEPELVFSSQDLPAIRERVERDPHRKLWLEILAEAEAYCTPDSDRYADPAQVDQGVARSGKLSGHSYGRRLARWIEALGFAFMVSEEARFADHGAAILVAAAKTLPVTDPRMAGSYAGGRGDLMRGLALGYDWLDERLSSEQHRLVTEVCAGYVQNILGEARRAETWWVPYHNYMGVAVGAAGCLAIKLRAAYPNDAQAWLDESTRLLQTWLDTAFDDQGANCEGTGYAVYALSNATLFMDALRRRGGANLFEHPHVGRIPHFYAMSLLPGERVFDARNDAAYAGLGDPFMLRLAGACPSGLARWLYDHSGEDRSWLRIVWDNPVKPLDPVAAHEPLAEHFSGRGLCVFRTGWQGQDVMFSIEAGPFFRKTHNQADKGHFTLYGLGKRWAIDSGYGNNQQPLGRAQSVAHNCVLVDGKGQALSGAGLGTRGKIIAYENRAQYGYALADCTEAYCRNSDGHPGVGLQRAWRHALFVRPSAGAPAYAVILDDFQKDDSPHQFTWLLHADAGMKIERTAQGTVIQPEGQPAQAGAEPSLHVLFHAAAPIDITVDRYEDHPRLNAAARAVNPNFVAVLVPLPAQKEEPDVRFVESQESIEVIIQWPGRHDRMVWPREAPRVPELWCAPSIEAVRP